ncbi:hypothetical protein [Nocardioides baculatus]|uniref:Uncharacterized protein n=1 Tax=Nocardioides baculatus TaxID=2801337 RepID=A0ABS1LC39_9ACTN|nr:hypothetical protein [Nocardioides baculatus]MBL0749224.1 hypothetical protein [Nocardioides baculatus]
MDGCGTTALLSATPTSTAIDAAVERLGTVRLGWGQVFGRPCTTATRVGRLLEVRGWHGVLTLCPQCPETDRLAG